MREQIKAEIKECFDTAVGFIFAGFLIDFGFHIFDRLMIMLGMGW